MHKMLLGLLVCLESWMRYLVEHAKENVTVLCQEREKVFFFVIEIQAAWEGQIFSSLIDELNYSLRPVIAKFLLETKSTTWEISLRRQDESI